MRKVYVTVLILIGLTLTLSGCGHYWGHRHGPDHSHYHGCGHRGR